MALPFAAVLPWLLNVGRGASAFAGTRGLTGGLGSVLKKGRKWDYDKVEGWQRPLWQRPTPTGATGARGAGGRFVGGNPRLQPGWINRLYMNPTTKIGGATRLAGLTAGGSIAADRINSMMKDDPSLQMEDIKAIRGSIAPSNATPTKLDFESRQDFEERKAKKLNNQMKRLIQYYGIVNLVNPTQAAKMLEIGAAMLEQEIAQMGTTRQAKIFDAIFKGGSMPASGAEAAKMILDAGGTAEDVADIADIYESITPKAPDLAEDERGVLDLQRARTLVQAGYDSEAVNLIEDSIRAGRLENEQEAGMPMNPRKQAQMMVQAMGGAASGGLDSSLLNIEPE